MKVKLLHFEQKKVGYHRMVVLTIHSYVTIRSFFEEVRPNAHKLQQTVTFLDALLAFVILLADLHSKINNSAYLRLSWFEEKLYLQTN